MNIKRISDGEVFEVRKYIKGNGEESAWCDDWYGHHVVGVDCELVNTYTAEDMEAFAEWISINATPSPLYGYWILNGTGEEVSTARLWEDWEDWKAKQRGEATE